ncbi:L-rhamnose mutarotase [Algibacter sp.]|nr:L-rhamnose mutarotase [Algibacter sp.]
MKKYCFALDLVNDPELIEEYIAYHDRVWPEIIESILGSGIENLEIYCVANRLFLIMEVNNEFSLEKKQSMDENNPKVQEWETLMWKYQRAVPTAKKGEKWLLMNRIYQLKA